MEITVFLLRSQICQSESLCQTDLIFGKKTVELGPTKATPFKYIT